MKNEFSRFLIFSGTLVATLLLNNCDSSTDPEVPNKAPSCSISAPSNNAAIELGTTAQIMVSASDTDGSIANVKISIDDVIAATLQASPYTYDWNTTGVATGPHNVKAVATDNGGLTCTSQITLNVAASNMAIVTTAEITAITATTATGGGNVTDDGGTPVTARGVVWGTMVAPTLDDNDGFTLDEDGVGSFSSSITSLVRVSNYNVRAYATNSAGTAYGDFKFFQTLPSAPTVTTRNITEIAAHVAAGGGEVTDDGGNPGVYSGIVWSTSHNPEYSNNEGYYFSPGGLLFDAPITGLNPMTKYYVRAYVTTHAQETYWYGEEKSFTTSAFMKQTGSFTDTRDNHQYNTVTISGQTWMAENLAYLPEVCPSTTDCGYWVYDYQGTDKAAAVATPNYATYGVLYHWETAQDVCPAGWHLPSNEEWVFLEVHLGMEISLTVGQNMRGTDEGGKLKETGIGHWDDPNEGATNVSGFTALPGGMRDSGNDTFFGEGRIGNFWTSTGIGNITYSRYLYNDSQQMGSQSFIIGQYGAIGFSVRCVKD